MSTAQTLTGNFPIGYRWIGSDWQKNFDHVLDWTVKNSFATIDLPSSHIGEAKKLASRGLKVASVDLAGWGGYQALITSDKAKRAAAVQQAAQTIRQGADAGATLFFTIMIPDQPDLPRAENFRYMIEAYAALAPVLEQAKAKLVVEGWPGPGALCCTPETYRAFLREIPSPALGINFDPSHLLRMGIDPMRFLSEFHRHVFHIHGKDTELNGENLYEFGHTQPATFTSASPFGEWAWRYTIPGHGQARWTAIFELLTKAGYNGMVSIELEDARFNGSESGEKLGLVKGRDYLEGC